MDDAMDAHYQYLKEPIVYHVYTEPEIDKTLKELHDLHKEGDDTVVRLQKQLLNEESSFTDQLEKDLSLITEAKWIRKTLEGMEEWVKNRRGQQGTPNMRSDEKGNANRVLNNLMYWYIYVWSEQKQHTDSLNYETIYKSIRKGGGKAEEYSQNGYFNATIERFKQGTSSKSSKYRKDNKCTLYTYNTSDTTSDTTCVKVEEYEYIERKKGKKGKKKTGRKGGDDKGDGGDDEGEGEPAAAAGKELSRKELNCKRVDKGTEYGDSLLHKLRSDRKKNDLDLSRIIPDYINDTTTIDIRLAQHPDAVIAVYHTPSYQIDPHIMDYLDETSMSTEPFEQKMKKVEILRQLSQDRYILLNSFNEGKVYNGHGLQYFHESTHNASKKECKQYYREQVQVGEDNKEWGWVIPSKDKMKKSKTGKPIEGIKVHKKRLTSPFKVLGAIMTCETNPIITFKCPIDDLHIVCYVPGATPKQIDFSTEDLPSWAPSPLIVTLEKKDSASATTIDLFKVMPDYDNTITTSLLPPERARIVARCMTPVYIDKDYTEFKTLMEGIEAAWSWTFKKDDLLQSGTQVALKESPRVLNKIVSCPNRNPERMYTLDSVKSVHERDILRVKMPWNRTSLDKTQLQRAIISKLPDPTTLYHSKITGKVAYTSTMKKEEAVWGTLAVTDNKIHMDQTKANIHMESSGLRMVDALTLNTAPRRARLPQALLPTNSYRQQEIMKEKESVWQENSARYHQYMYTPVGKTPEAGNQNMRHCLQSMQGDSSKSEEGGKHIRQQMKGAIMIMLFLLNPVLGNVTEDPSQKRYCSGQIETLKVALSMSEAKNVTSG